MKSQVHIRQMPSLRVSINTSTAYVNDRYITSTQEIRYAQDEDTLIIVTRQSTDNDESISESWTAVPVNDIVRMFHDDHTFLVFNERQEKKDSTFVTDRDTGSLPEWAKVGRRGKGMSGLIGEFYKTDEEDEIRVNKENQ